MYKLASTVVAAVSAIFLLTSTVEAAPRRNVYQNVKTCYVKNNGVRVCKTRLVKKPIKKKTRVTQRHTTPVTHAAIGQFNTGGPLILHQEAARFVGLHERRNRAAVQSITKINPARLAWCAAFVNGILARRGYSGTGSNFAISFARYGQQTREPQKGDIVVFRSHVGFFEGFTTRGNKRYVAVLGGNQSNQVKVSYFPASRVLSYRRAI